MVLKAVYKSPTTIHVFASPAGDLPLFPSIPPILPPTIRTQINLQGWSTEALSPTTTLVTLLNGTSVDTVQYDHDRGNLRIEYPGGPSRQTTMTPTPIPTSPTTSAEVKVQKEEEEKNPTAPTMECESRCDLDTQGLVWIPWRTWTRTRRKRSMAEDGDDEDEAADISQQIDSSQVDTSLSPKHPPQAVITPTFERVPTNGGDYSEWEEMTRITTETTPKRNEGGYWERVKGAFSQSSSQNGRRSRTNSVGGRLLHDGI